MNLEIIKNQIREIKDFPKEGIGFKDITPILSDPEAFRFTLNELAKRVEDLDVDIIISPEARGFIYGAPLAVMLNAGFVPVRKEGKLPAEVIRSEYELEYGSNVMEMHRDAIRPGQKVLIVDDLLATGGTVQAMIDMSEELGGEVVGILFVIELGFLPGRDELKNYRVDSLITF